MNIRTATPNDAIQIADIWNHYIRNTTATFNPVEKTADEIAAVIWDKAGKGLPFLIAHTDRVQGFATYGDFRTGLGYAKTQEHTILLDPTCTGMGIGRKLMTRLENHAQNAGIHSLIAGVSGENGTAIHFHLDCGFKQVARLNQVGFKFDRWHDLVFLQKVLMPSS